MDLTVYRRILQRELESRIEKDPAYSLRSFARSLEIDVSTLSRVLSRKKHLSFKAALRFASRLRLNATENEEFLNSVAEEQSQLGLTRMHPEAKRRSGSLVNAKMPDAAMEIAKEWYYFAILELTRTENFRYDSVTIAQRLDVGVDEVEKAVEQLIANKLLAVDEFGKLRKTYVYKVSDPTTTSADRRYHLRQMLERSASALRDIPIDHRCHHGLTMAIDENRIDEARDIIAEFSKHLCNVLSRGKTTKVYEFQVSLFPLEKIEQQSH